MKLVWPIVVFVSMMTLLTGCTHTTYVSSSKNPEVEFAEDGGLMWRGRFIRLEELPGLLEDSGVGKKSQIDIRVPGQMRSMKAPRALLFILRRAGYTRGVLVTKKRAYSSSTMSQPSPSSQQPQPRPQNRGVRYK